MVHCDSDQHKRQGYATDLCDDNIENDLDAAIASAGIEGDHINSGCVYSDIDDGRQNPTLCLLSVIGNIKAQAPTPDPPRSDIVTFRPRGQPVPLNNWENPHYFTSAFPCLFPFGTGDHLEQRKGPMSLETWAKWTIQHHSHRYVYIVQIIEQANFNYRFTRHPVFMFVVYDVIHRRKAVLEYSLLIKSGIWEKTEELIREITYA